MSPSAAITSDALLDPPALEPFEVRRTLLLFLIGLACVLHVATAGWGPLFNETDGQYAGAAREMLETGDWLVPTNNGVPQVVKPPLLYWATASSLAAFGQTEFAARLPVALSVVALVVLTFLIGERLGGTWCGFCAGLILLTATGTFVFGRMLMPEPPFAAGVAGAFYCLLRGFENRRGRRWWFLCFWGCAALAVLVKGIHGVLYPLAAVAVLLPFYREARLRFRGLISIMGVAVLLGVNMPWRILLESRFPGLLRELWTTEVLGHLAGEKWPRTFEDVPALEFVFLHGAWWFPWSLFLGLPALVALPALLRGRWRMPDSKSALLLAWAGVVFVPLLVLGQRQDYYAFSMWPAAAVGAALLWRRLPDRARLFGPVAVMGVGAIGLVVAFVAPRLFPVMSADSGTTIERATASRTVAQLPASFWAEMVPLAGLAAAALLLFGAIASFAALRGRFRFALVAMAAGMVPLGFSVIEGVSKVSPYFSLSRSARHINLTTAPGTAVVYDAPLRVGSSLLFYLDRPLFLVGQDPTEEFAVRAGQVVPEQYWSEAHLLARWAAGDPVILISERARSDRWQTLLPGGTVRFEEGSQVVIGPDAP